ncbi:DJ-1/PfpI family protein [Sporobolomyces koalae]|uniref:DJ-1/PfpI family protein n=1 Tax=Sporobolomyces koalae TaxID=500713 RepID=UPI003172111D
MTSPRNENPFKKLVRSLSRSSPRGERPSTGPRQKSADRLGASSTATRAAAVGIPGAANKENSPGLGTAFSTSPAPDSYFPAPPAHVLSDAEAAGIERHPDSVGARAFDVGEDDVGKAAPGVSFAPRANGETAVRPDSELESWQPAPRRTPSQRVRRQPSSSTRGQLTRGRSNGHDAAPPVPEVGQETVTIGGRTVDKGDRKGVSLSDTPLSRRTSVKRAASSFKKAVSKSFEPAPKAEGEKRIMVLVADGTEEIEVMTALDIFVRASLSPVLVSVSPEFSPSHSLPHITLSRGAKILADTQFETLKPEHKADFDAVIVPGGAKGAERLSRDEGVKEYLFDSFEAGKLIGCICAGSLAAKTAGIGLGLPITSHPSVKGDLEKHYEYSEARVVVAENLVTSRGPGTAIEWSLKIVEILAGKAKRDEVAGPMML